MSHSGRLSPRTAMISPREAPSDASPWAVSWTRRSYSPQVRGCQMPYCFSCIATASRRVAARSTSNWGKVSFGRSDMRIQLVLGSEVVLDQCRVGHDLRQRSATDQGTEVQDADAVRDVHDDVHVVLDEDDRDVGQL